jgi:glyoxylase-like metal-dependent hydrolase (beta-lactamase superfamily II)
MIASWLGRQWGPPPLVDGYLRPEEILHLGESTLEIRHVPGHSPGSVVFIDHEGRRVWSGDALFAGSIGRTDLPGGNYAQLLQSIHTQILTLPDDYKVYPGHGPFTTIGQERRSNPFLNDEG